jgi:hypothetical protein
LVVKNGSKMRCVAGEAALQTCRVPNFDGDAVYADDRHLTALPPSDCGSIDELSYAGGVLEGTLVCVTVTPSQLLHCSLVWRQERKPLPQVRPVFNGTSVRNATNTSELRV